MFGPYWMKNQSGGFGNDTGGGYQQQRFNNFGGGGFGGGFGGFGGGFQPQQQFGGFGGGFQPQQQFGGFGGGFGGGIGGLGSRDFYSQMMYPQQQFGGFGGGFDQASQYQQMLNQQQALKQAQNQYEQYEQSLPSNPVIQQMRQLQGSFGPQGPTDAQAGKLQELRDKFQQSPQYQQMQNLMPQLQKMQAFQDMQRQQQMYGGIGGLGYSPEMNFGFGRRQQDFGMRPQPSPYMPSDRYDFGQGRGSGYAPPEMVAEEFGSPGFSLIDPREYTPGGFNSPYGRQVGNYDIGYDPGLRTGKYRQDLYSPESQSQRNDLMRSMLGGMPGSNQQTSDTQKQLQSRFGLSAEQAAEASKQTQNPKDLNRVDQRQQFELNRSGETDRQLRLLAEQARQEYLRQQGRGG